MMNTFRDVIASWPSRSALAEDASVSAGVVKQWHLRDSIPASRWEDIVKAAQKRKISGISLAVLASLARRQTLPVVVDNEARA